MKTLFFLTIISFSLYASKMVATVKMYRGSVFKQLPDGKKVQVKDKGEKITEGTVIITEQGSFAQLRFIDNSVVNVGPKSEMKIEQFSRNKPGLLSVVKGEIRSQVTKDYLEIGKDERDKLYVKSKSAAMGIRGTDFIYSFNPGNNTTTAVLLEGEVAFAKVAPGASYEDVKNNVINNSVTLYPGEFSVSKPELKAPSVPAVLNVKQKELLVKNHNNGNEKKKAKTEEVAKRAPASVVKKSIVPPGLTGNVVANEAKGVDEGVKQVAKTEVTKAVQKRVEAGDAKGFVKSGAFKPANGSIVHIGTGIVIPPSENSVFDKNTNSYISTGDDVVLDDSGNYHPPQEDVVITEDGKIATVSTDGNQVIHEPPPPVLGGADNMTFLSEAPPPPDQVMDGREPASIDGDGKVVAADDPNTNQLPSNDVLDGGFVQNGLNDISIQDNNTGFDPAAADQNSTVIRFNIQVN